MHQLAGKGWLPVQPACRAVTYSDINKTKLKESIVFTNYLIHGDTVINLYKVLLTTNILYLSLLSIYLNRFNFVFKYAFDISRN